MIRSATRSELAPLRELLMAANDGPYAIEIVAEEKLFGAGFWGEPRLRVFEEDGSIRGIAVTCGNYLRLLAIDPHHRRRGIGTKLLEDSQASVFAAEPGNYFTPGVVDSDSGTIAFLRSRGFRESGSTWNMHVGIRDSGFVIRDDHESRITNHESLFPFVNQHFGPVWAFETQRAAAAFYVENTAFAVIEANNRGLGTFGPAGVIESKRGQGYGRRLLLASLAALRRLGYERAIIPWTDAITYYRKSCGAEPAHRFLIFRR